MENSYNIKNPTLREEIAVESALKPYISSGKPIDLVVLQGLIRTPQAEDKLVKIMTEVGENL